jgi:hypothetical protein
MRRSPAITGSSCAECGVASTAARIIAVGHKVAVLRVAGIRERYIADDRIDVQALRALQLRMAITKEKVT